MMKKLFCIFLSTMILINSNLITFGKVIFLPAGFLTISSAYSTPAYAKYSEYSRKDKNKGVATVLALFFGAHHFYLNNTKTGATYVILSFFYGLGQILSLIDFFTLVFMSDQEWQDYIESERILLFMK